MQIQINTMCVCISLSAYVTLFCLFSPKVSIILLHPDKNVRKLTMNSATYKRGPFKQVSSHASLEGGKNGTNTYSMGTGGAQGGYTTIGSGGGGYAVAGAGQTDGPSGGPMSTTSNILNPGESSQRSPQATSGANEKATAGCWWSFCCWSCGIRWLGFGACWSRVRNFSLIGCWRALTDWLASCCSVGELGPTTALELDSFDSAAAAPSSSAPQLQLQPLQSMSAVIRQPQRSDNSNQKTHPVGV